MLAIYTSTHPRADVDIGEEERRRRKTKKKVKEESRRRKAGKAYWGNCTNQTRILFVAILPINITMKILSGVTTERVIVGKPDSEKLRLNFQGKLRSNFMDEKVYSIFERNLVSRVGQETNLDMD